MTDTYSFDEQLEMGKRWEKDLCERLESILTKKTVRNIQYEDEPEKQRSGIDAVVSEKTPDIDVKVQRHSHLTTGNIPIETWSVKEREKRGWFYTGKSDVIAWVYKNKAGTNLHPTAYLMLKNERFIDWFEDNIHKFREVDIPNESWTTVCRLVPIEEIPENYLIEFNPTLDEDKNEEQHTLLEWSN